MTDQAQAGGSYDEQDGGGGDTGGAPGRGFPGPDEGGKPFDPPTGGEGDQGGAAGKGFPITGDDD